MEKLTLITGEFSHAEAREILMNVFSTKINFHQLKNFSALERLGVEDAVALQRIPALREEVARLEMLLAAAKNTHKRLHIRSEVIIEYLDEADVNPAADTTSVLKTTANSTSVA